MVNGGYSPVQWLWILKLSTAVKLWRVCDSSAPYKKFSSKAEFINEIVPIGESSWAQKILREAADS